MGVVDNTKGKAKEAIGEVAGNNELKRDGKVDRGKGKLKDAVDSVGNKLTGK